MEWYLKAAEQGWADAQYIVGAFYSNGYGGIKVNEAEALKWYYKAAEQGLQRRNLFWGLTINVAKEE